MTPVGPRILINWLYYPASGHLLEALKHAEGYRLAHPDADIHVLLPAGPVARFVRLPSITTHAIRLHRPRRDLGALPREWDFVITNPRLPLLTPRSGLRLFAATRVAAARFVGRSGEASAPVLDELLGRSSTPVLPYVRNATVRLSVDVPDEIRRALAGSPNICVLPAGSSCATPSISAWRTIGQALLRGFPRAQLHFTGVSDRRARIATFVDQREVEELARQLGSARVWWDEPVSVQFALFASCDLLISPHTGFAFWASTLGTPWLVLSGCRWPEYLLNGTPFHSVLPDCGSYPTLNDDETPCGQRIGASQPPLCMERLVEKQDEIVDAAGTLLNDALSFDEALARHLERVDRHPGRKRFFFFDGRENLQGTHPLPTA